MHNPDGVGVLHELIIPEDWFEIPLRSLIVKGLDNLLVSGRCMSATHEAQGAIREMPTRIEAGRGEGVAAAPATKNEIPVRELDTKTPEKGLIAQGIKLQPGA